MKVLWWTLLAFLLCLPAWGQEDSPTWLQVDSIAGPAVQKETGLSLHWNGDSAPGLPWSLTILHGEERVLRLLSGDGIQRNRMGWRPDLDPTPGNLKIRLNELWLATGEYTVLVELADGRRQDFKLHINEQKASSNIPITVTSPTNVTRIMGWRLDANQGHHAYAWWPIQTPGDIQISLSDQEWTLLTDGRGPPNGTQTIPGVKQITILDGEQVLPSHQRNGTDSSVLWLGVFPLGLIFAFLGGVGFWRGRNTEDVQGALFLSAIIAFLIVQPMLNDPGAFLLDADVGDPTVILSIAELATLSNAFQQFHSQGDVFLWPDGVSAWNLSPGWLSQIPPAILSATVDPIIGHNISVAVGLALLCFFSWALIRSLGASQGAAWMGAVACTLAPRILQDLDSQSIEQCSLFLLPLFLLNLHQALDDEGPWPAVLAGATLAAAFHSHQTMGLFLLLVAPVMVGFRLPGPNIRKRLLRVGTLTLTTILLIAPSFLLESDPTTLESNPSTGLIDSTVNLFRPFENQAINQHWNSGSAPVESIAPPLRQLLLTVSNSLYWKDISTPQGLLSGGYLYWPLALAALLVSRKRRPTAIALAEVSILLLCVLGPFLRLESGRMGPALPYYGFYLWFPGLENCSRIHIFAWMAAALAPIPIALGLDGAADQVANMWSRILHFGRLQVLGARTRVSPILTLNRLLEPFIWQFKYAPYAPLLMFGLCTSLGYQLTIIGTISSNVSAENQLGKEGTSEHWPNVRSIPRLAGLRGLHDSTMMVLPLMQDTTPNLILPLLRSNIRLVNPALTRSTSAPNRSWIEDNPLLNQIAWTSGSDGPRYRMSYDPKQADFYTENLINTGLDYILMSRSKMPSEELILETEHLLDGLFPRVQDDGELVSWAVQPIGELE